MSKYLKQKMIHDKLIDLIMNAAHENTTIKEVKEIAAKVTTIMRTTHYKEHEKQIDNKFLALQDGAFKKVSAGYGLNAPETFDVVSCPECGAVFNSHPAGVNLLYTGCAQCGNKTNLKKERTIVRSRT